MKENWGGENWKREESGERVEITEGVEENKREK